MKFLIICDHSTESCREDISSNQSIKSFLSIFLKDIGAIITTQTKEMKIYTIIHTIVLVTISCLQFQSKVMYSNWDVVSLCST